MGEEIFIRCFQVQHPFENEGDQEIYLADSTSAYNHIHISFHHKVSVRECAALIYYKHGALPYLEQLLTDFFLYSVIPYYAVRASHTTMSCNQPKL